MGRSGNTQIYTSKCVHFGELPGEELYGGKSTERPRTGFIIANGILLVLLFAVTLQLINLSFKFEELKGQSQTNRELIQQCMKTQKTPDKTAGDNTVHDEKKPNENSQNVAEPKRVKRSKRAVAYRRRHAGPCHLEGRPGPNSVNSDRAEQRPASINQSILWKTDNEPHSYCLMETERDRGNNGIQYIRINKEGFYRVYAQLTYDVGTGTETGHSIDVSRIGSTVRKTLLRTLAPWQSTSKNPVHTTALESKHTSGVFYLTKGERLSVHPLKPRHLVVMTETDSFFGAIYVGGRLGDIRK